MSDTKTREPIPSISDLGPRFFAFVEALERPVAFFDLETTGTDPQIDRIVEICVVRVCPLPVAIEQPNTWRVNPEIRIPAEASDVHGILNENVKDSPRFADLADEIAALFHNTDIAGFAVSRFDMRLLQAEFQRCGKSIDFSQSRVVDAQSIYHRREPRTLSAALQFYRNRVLENAHGAQADTIASLEVFAGQLERYSDLEVNIDALHTQSAMPNSNYVDSGRRFQWRDNEPVFNFGKLRGKGLRWAATDPQQRDYLRWIIQGPFDEETKEIVRDALVGKIRMRQPNNTESATPN